MGQTDAFGLAWGECFSYLKCQTLLPMSEDQKRQLESQLWNIANTLRGKMGTDEFRDYILGFHTS